MPPRKAPPAACPLPVQTTQLARGLIRLHARLRGELSKAKDGEETLVDPDTAAKTVAHIEPLVRFLGVNFVPSAVKPIRTRPKIGPLAFGDLQGEMLAVLRDRGDWMTYAALADAIIGKQGLNLTAAQYRHFLQKLREAAHFLRANGAVEREKEMRPGEREALQRLRLSQTLFRRR